MVGKRESWLLILMVVVAIVGIAGCDNNARMTVDWVHDWDEAQSLAEAQHRPMMINFYTDTCPACKALDRGAFSDGDLGTFLNDNFVNLKSNAGKSGLFVNYGLSGVPTTVFATPSGEEISRLVGTWPTGEFKDAAEQVFNHWTENLADRY